MANHSLPTVSSQYANYTAEIKSRIDDALLMLDPATTTPTAVPTNAIRFSSAAAKWQKWNGSSWVDPVVSYAITVATAETWATSRSFTVGDSTKSVNGSANVSWTLEEVGALSNAEGSVTTTKLANGAATGVKLGSDVVTVGSSQTISGSKRLNHVTQGITAVSALDIACGSGNYFTKSVSTNSTFTFSGVPAGVAYGFTLEVYHTGGAITWPASVAWPYTTAPTLTAGRTHLFMFITDDGGTRWRGAVLPDYTT